MKRSHFEKLVEHALERIPQRFRAAMDNVAILVEDWPDPRLVEEVTGDADEMLYGLFEGTPLPARRVEDSGELPAVIYLFRKPLMEDFPESGELEHEIEVTLVHEIAHFMGLDEDVVRAYGYG